MLRNNLLLAAAFGALVIATPPPFAQAQTETEGVTNPEAAAARAISPGVEEVTEREIPISEVPEAAIEAAKGVLGADPEEAYLVTVGEAQQVYEIEATKDGEERAVYVTAAGEVVEREAEAEEEKQ